MGPSWGDGEAPPAVTTVGDLRRLLEGHPADLPVHVEWVEATGRVTPYWVSDSSARVSVRKDSASVLDASWTRVRLVISAEIDPAEHVRTEDRWGVLVEELEQETPATTSVLCVADEGELRAAAGAMAGVFRSLVADLVDDELDDDLLEEIRQLDQRVGLERAAEAAVRFSVAVKDTGDPAVVETLGLLRVEVAVDDVAVLVSALSAIDGLSQWLQEYISENAEWFLADRYSDLGDVDDVSRRWRGPLLRLLQLDQGDEGRRLIAGGVAVTPAEALAARFDGWNGKDPSDLLDAGGVADVRVVVRRVLAAWHGPRTGDAALAEFVALGGLPESARR